MENMDLLSEVTHMAYFLFKIKKSNGYSMLLKNLMIRFKRSISA